MRFRESANIFFGGESCSGVMGTERELCPCSEPPRFSCGPEVDDDCELERAIISSAAVRLCGWGERYCMYEDDLERERPAVDSSALCGLSFLDAGLPFTGVPFVDGRPSVDGAGEGAVSVL